MSYPQMPGKISEEAMQEQAERAEYVKNIGIEYRFGCYEEKRPESCQLLGEYMEALQQNFSAALAIFKKNCDEFSYPKSCFKYGMYMLAGKAGDDANLSKMIRPMKIACDANIPQGCRYLALVHWNGEKDRKADSEKAERYMRRACELEDGEACWLLSTWYMGNKEKFKTTASGEAKELDRSDLGQLSRDMEKSLQYAIRACDLDIPQSCANVSRMFKLGDGVPKDLDQAKKYADRAKEIMDVMRSNDTSAGFTA